LRVVLAILTLIVTLGLFAILPALIAALIRGGMNGRKHQKMRKREIDTFD